MAFGWDGSVRGKFGYLASPTVLVYGSGGVAFQQLSVGATCDGGNGSWCGYTLNIIGPQRSESASTVRAGWTVGGGLEAVLAGNWLGKLEFRYADFGQFDHAFFAGTADEVDTSVHLQTYTFLAGIGYKFNGPVGMPGRIMAPTLAADVAFEPPHVSVGNPWTGCYAGGNAGDVWGSSAFNWTNLTNAGFGAAAPLIPTAANATLDNSVFTAGGQAGCDYQTDGIVSGLEGDFEYTGLAASRSAVSLGNTNGGPPTIVPGSISKSFSSPWLSTVRGRLGFANGAWLFYGTGGLAMANVQFADQVCFPAAATPSCNTASSSNRRAGWAAGGGSEWKIAPKWSVRAEYLYADLGSTSYTSTNPLFPSANITHNHNLSESIAKIGFNYQFDWDRVAAQ